MIFELMIHTYIVNTNLCKIREQVAGLSGLLLAPVNVNSINANPQIASKLLASVLRARAAEQHHNQG